jgi:hypothetical protein
MFIFVPNGNYFLGQLIFRMHSTAITGSKFGWKNSNSPDKVPEVHIRGDIPRKLSEEMRKRLEVENMVEVIDHHPRKWL